MKKIFYYLLFLFALTNANAQQISYTFNSGMAIGYPRELNNYLRAAGLPTLRTVGVSLGCDIKIQNNRFTVHIEPNYLFYRSQEQNPYVSTQGLSFGNSIGYLVVNKYKTTIEPFIGLKYLNAFSLNIQNNTATNNIATQLQKFNSTQINYRLGVLFHVGLQAKITIAGRFVTFKAGHHVRLSQTKWFNNIPLQPLSDTPNFNPVGTYLTIGFSL